MLRFVVLIITFISFLNRSAYSQTVGVLAHSTDVYDGYTLMAPTSTDFAYLIDVCGRVVHSWDTGVRPGLRTILTPEGNLLRSERQPGAFFGGGIGGGFRMLDWDGNLLWSFDYSNDDVHQHHDVDLMPNGNVLAIAWEVINEDDAIALGRNPQNVNQRGIWPDHIIEYNPDLDSIVWSWHAKDHLIQDFDPTKLNYGVVSDHPELIDININGTVNGDWNHLNSVNYNPELDQIVLSSRTFNEIWIIDHSTTTEEAVGHTGGRYGKGGDLLYRWGNPRNYGRGTVQDQRLFGQHDARWIADDRPDRGKIMIFNNGVFRPEGNFSTVDIIDPQVDMDGNYIIEDGSPYEPIDADIAVSGAPNDLDVFSDRISGANQMPNGNILFCLGLDGRLMEVSKEGEVLWDYVNPLNGTLPVTQGEMPFSNQIFKVTKYGIDYPAFEGKNLTPGDPLELDFDIDECVLLTSSKQEVKEESLTVYPNPTSGNVVISCNTKSVISILDISGKRMGELNLNEGRHEINLTYLHQGVYFLANQKGERVKLVIVP